MYYGKIPDHRRRFIRFVGDGFVVGLVSSSAFHFVNGLRGSPRGGRLAGGAQAVCAKAPAFACWLSAYAAVSCSLEIAMSIARRREDNWNSIAAGAASMGLLEMPRGARAAALSALIGAAVVVIPWPSFRSGMCPGQFRCIWILNLQSRYALRLHRILTEKVRLLFRFAECATIMFLSRKV
ncbi:unnamed protein product [Urochloa humidicola]